MQKLLLISILIATLAIPMRAARSRSATVGLRRTVVYLVAFNCFYMLALFYLYPRLF